MQDRCIAKGNLITIQAEASRPNKQLVTPGHTHIAKRVAKYIPKWINHGDRDQNHEQTVNQVKRGKFFLQQNQASLPRRLEQCVIGSFAGYPVYTDQEEQTYDCLNDANCRRIRKIA